MPDGHYCSYDFSKGDISVEVVVKNRKKEGIENRYFSAGNEKYATITWINGIKNGLETHYNANKTIKYILSFKDNVLDGFFVINWSEGEKNYDGFYKNGYRDSLWTYYKVGIKSNDTSDYLKFEQYQYREGKPYLISAWNEQGLETIIDGNGMSADSSYYLNVMKNGRQVTIKRDGTTKSVRTYKDDLLVNETSYFDNNQVESISEWSYPLPAKVDTTKEWIDTCITNIFYNSIAYRHLPVRNGYWVACYPNRIKIYEGNYIDGRRVNVWEWNYPNGKPWIVVDFTKNSWQHFDTTGKIISNFSNEFLTNLTNGSWFLNKKLDASSVTFTKYHTKAVTSRFVFHYDGLLEINSLS